MSYQAVRWVFENSRTKKIQRLILLAIAEHANEQGEAWPSLERLATFTNESRRTVCKNLAKLKTSGEIEISTGGGKGKSNRYRIKMSAGNPAASDRECPPNSVPPDTVSNHPNSVPPDPNSVPPGIQTVSGGTLEPSGTDGTTKRGFAARVCPAPDGAANSLPFRSPNFSQAWQDWHSHLRDKKKNLGPTQERITLAHLAKMPEGAAIRAIEHSIRSGFQTIFPAPEPQERRTPAKPEDRNPAKNFRL
jgi:DNA-binding transcriptional MocR family regulator